jgi:chorismate mutase/prephenate dehydratase
MKRAEFVREIGGLKNSGKTSIYRPDREREVYRNIEAYARELYGGELPFPVQALENVYREIMSGSISIEGGPSIAFLGPPASFSHSALRMRFGSSLTEIPLESIPAVFRAVSGGEANYGIVPVDNSSGGTVGPTHDMLLRSDLRIYAEQYIRVSQHLLHTEDVPVSEIRRLYTIRIAYDQCREWIQEHMRIGESDFIETSSTASAAERVAKIRDGAAIASELAADLYGLKIIARNIQDSPNNITRFVIIGNEQCLPTGDDKTSIICSVNDRPGSLFRLLEPFFNEGINLSRIESVITRKSYGDYNFFIDFHGHKADPKISRILEILEERTAMLKILGSYPRSDLP